MGDLPLFMQKFYLDREYMYFFFYKIRAAHGVHEKSLYPRWFPYSIPRAPLPSVLLKLLLHQSIGAENLSLAKFFLPFHPFLLQWRTSLAVQWLRLHASSTGGTGWIPAWETKVPHPTLQGQRRKKGVMDQHFPGGPVAKSLHS